jgi:hypothetical protein
VAKASLAVGLTPQVTLKTCGFPKIPGLAGGFSVMIAENCHRPELSYTKKQQRPLKENSGDQNE